MIFAVSFGKGGVGKSTIAHCLAHSQAFRKRFGSVALVDLDPQGSLSTIVRDRGDRPLQGVTFKQILGDKPAAEIKRLAASHGAIVLDVPGHHGFAVKFAMSASDLVIVPCRSTLPDEAALAEKTWPYLRDQPRADLRVVIVPSMTHPQSRPETHAAYFRALLPDLFRVSAVPFPSRSVYEVYNRDGLCLAEYAEAVKGNQRARSQADRAIADIESLPREILKHAAT